MKQCLAIMTSFSERLNVETALQSRRQQSTSRHPLCPSRQPATVCCRVDPSGAAPLWPSQILCTRPRPSHDGRIGQRCGRSMRRQLLCLAAAAVAEGTLQLPGAQLDRVRILQPATRICRWLMTCDIVQERHPKGQRATATPVAVQG